jgi:hypothetical protein
MTTAVADPTVGTLMALAREANRAHRKVSQTEEAALEAAIRAGRALQDAYQLVPQGRWTQWVVDNCEMSMASVRAYRRFAHYETDLRATGARSIGEAKRILAGLAPIDGTDMHTPANMRVYARRSVGASRRRVSRVKETAMVVASAESDPVRKQAWWQLWEVMIEAEAIIADNLEDPH